MKEASTELTFEERGIVDSFSAKSAINSAFVEENRTILNALPNFEEDLSLFDADTALTEVKAKIQRPEALVLEMKPVAKAKTMNYQKWAAAAFFLIGLSTMVYLFYGIPSGQTNFVSSDRTETIQLTDGSEVVLNKHASLSLADGFGNKLRDMRLEGEAYFKVKNNNDQPFTVKVGDLEIEVLGTEFNIKNESGNNKINVFVAEGKVKVSSLKTGTKVILNAGESSTFNKTSRALLKDKTDKANAISWMNDKLRFVDAKLIDVIHDIENHFDISIELQNTKLENCPYTSIFNGATADKVLETISAVFDIQIMKEGEATYSLTGGTCSK